MYGSHPEQVLGLLSSFHLISLIYGDNKYAFATQHVVCVKYFNRTTKSLKIIETMVIYINSNAST